MKTNSAGFRTMAWFVAVVFCWLTIGLSTSDAALYYWYNIGPRPINTLDTNNNIVNQDNGRVPALAVDPSDTNHWLIGTAQGGVWETTDGGNSFGPRSDDQASLAVGAIAFAPNSPSTVYAGTGEANFRGDAYAGAGLLLSQDGGTHWQMLNTNFAKTSFSRIVVNPVNATNLAVATARGTAGVGEESAGYGAVPGAPPRGVFVSANGGTNFTRVLTGEATALVANPRNFNEQYAGLGEIYGDPTNGVYRTTDGWQTSQLIQGPWIMTNYMSINLPIATNLVINCSNGPCVTNIIITYTNIVTGTNISAGGRIAMAISSSSTNVLYVGVALTRSRYTAYLDGIWMTTNAWDTNPEWTLLPAPPVAHDGINTPRFWYMFDLLVDPENPATLYLAEFNVWQYAAGNWNQMTDEGNAVHPDNHVMTWVPGPEQTYRMLLGNDGGVFVSDPGVSGQWTDLNAGLRITLFYKGAVDPAGLNLIDLGGAQDDYTSLYTGSPGWTMTMGGDGGDCAISAANPLNDWAVSFSTLNDNDAGYNKVDILRTRTAGMEYDYAADAITNCLPFSRQFYVHFEKAPYNDDLVIAGTATLWRCTNYFSGTIPSWTLNSPEMTGSDGAPVSISAMAFAASDTNGEIYAFGTEDGQLWITGNGGGQWNNLNPAGAVPGRYVSGLAFSPTDANTLYVSLSGFDEGTPGQPGHLFKITNALAAPPAWANISPPVDLPNNCVAIDPNLAASIYVGTDIGVWNSADGGGSWTHYGPGNGLPNVAVYDLRFNSSSQLTAFTHGRGAYLFSKLNLPILVFPIRDIYHPTPNCLQCPPDLFWINPGDQESVDLPLQNILSVDTVDLQVTMLPSAQIMPITGTQDYGVVKGQGAAVSRTFQFIAGSGAGGPGAPPPAGSACGDTVQAVFQLQDQGVSLGQVTVPFRLGTPSHPLVEDFEELPPPGLAPGWTSAATGIDPPWISTTNPPPNSPGGGGGEDDFGLPAVINTSAFVPDVPGSGQSFLMSPPFVVATPQAELYFREAFAVSNAFDGCILEIAIGSLPFQEITQAGGTFTQDGYNTLLSDLNPLGPRSAWSGNSGGWIPVQVNLPPSAAGQSVQLRWHFATSRGLPNGAWFVDSVKVTEPVCLPPVSNPIIINPALSGTGFAFAINTVSNRNYLIQYKTNLTDAVWQTLESISGNGNRQNITVPIGPTSHLFYRFSVQ